MPTFTIAATDQQSPNEPEEDDSRPPGAGGKEGPGNTDGRDAPYSEEPESEERG